MRDIGFVIVTITIIAFSSIFGWIFLQEFMSQEIFQNEPLVNETMIQAQTTLDTTLDSGFLILFVGLFSGAMVLGHLLPTRPIFFVPFIFILMFLVTIVALVSNMYNAWITDPTIAGYIAGKFIFMTFVMENLPFLTAGLGILLAIIIYGSAQSQQKITG